MVSFTKIRRLIQLASALAMNANIGGLVTGKIYRGQLKRICVPGLNCYSCPAAVGACPLGSLQFAIGSAALPALAYTAGLLTLFGVLLGRAVCGFLCPFGLVQELIHTAFGKLRPPGRSKRGTRENTGKYFGHSLPRRNIKYIILAGTLALPLAAYAAEGLGTPVFCKYICPAGVLAGFPLLALNPPLRQAAGLLFGWKTLVLLFVILASSAVYRPFCRICPLGAIYGLFNNAAVVGMAVDREKCGGCGGCGDVCPMHTRCTSRECIRCGRCAEKCPAKAVKYTVLKKG